MHHGILRGTGSCADNFLVATQCANRSFRPKIILRGTKEILIDDMYSSVSEFDHGGCGKSTETFARWGIESIDDVKKQIQ